MTTKRSTRNSTFPPRNREQDVARAQELGLESYLQELEEKCSILDKLLVHWNDGRRKTFFDTAVYLLPLEELRSALDALEHQPQLVEQPVKERALAAVALFQEMAGRQGVSLKLNKKSKKE